MRSVSIEESQDFDEEQANDMMNSMLVPLFLPKLYFLGILLGSFFGIYIIMCLSSKCMYFILFYFI